MRSGRKKPQAQVLWWLVFALVLGAFATLSSQALAVTSTREIFVPPIETTNSKTDNNWTMTNVGKTGSNTEAHFQWIIPIDSDTNPMLPPMTLKLMYIPTATVTGALPCTISRSIAMVGEADNSDNATPPSTVSFSPATAGVVTEVNIAGLLPAIGLVSPGTDYITIRVSSCSSNNSVINYPNIAKPTNEGRG